MIHPGLIVLDWHRDSKGYEVVQTSGDPVVVGKGGATHRYTVRAGDKNIFVELAGMPHTPAAACIFVNRWGPLLGDICEPGVRHYPTNVKTLYRSSDLIRTTVTRFGKAPTNSLRGKALAAFEESFQGMPVWRIEPKLRHNIDDGAPELIFSAGTLLDFLYLEMLSALLGGAKPTACARCGTVTSKSKFAASKMYCSARCRKAAERARHREEGREARAIVGRVPTFAPEDYECGTWSPY
jgi:hypothetical protein